MTKRANQWANLTTHHQSDLVLPLANHTESHPGDITKRETLLSLGRQKHNMGQFDTKSIGCLRQSHCISGWQLATGWLHQSLLRGWSGVVVNKCKQDKQVCFFCSPPPFSGPLVQKLLSRGIKGSRVVQFWRLPSGWMWMWCLWTLSLGLYGFPTHPLSISNPPELRRVQMIQSQILMILDTSLVSVNPQEAQAKHEIDPLHWEGALWIHLASVPSPNTPRNSLRFDRFVV